MTFLEISQWCNPRSLLVIDEKGSIKRIHCPFVVICIDGIGELAEFKTYKVDAVKMTEQGRIVYEINKNSYYHSAFKIVDLN